MFALFALAEVERKSRWRHQDHDTTKSRIEMTPARTYIPSRALLRALSRPQPLPCPYAHLRTPLLIRGKSTRDAKIRKDVGDEIAHAESTFKNEAAMNAAMRPSSDKDLDPDLLPTINWYEQDVARANRPRLISSTGNVEDRKKENEISMMIEESQQNPDYDDADLNRRLMDSLITNPNFADLAQELREIKAGIKTKKELELMDKEAERKLQLEEDRINASFRMSAHQVLQGLIDDPDIGEARDGLQEVLDQLPETDDLYNPEFQSALAQAMAKVDNNKVMQAKMAARLKESTFEDVDKEWADLEKNIDQAIEDNEKDDMDTELDPDVDMGSPEAMAELDKLIHQMREVVKTMGGNSGLEAELNAALEEEPSDSEEGRFDREMDTEELGRELETFVESLATQPQQTEQEEEEENVPLELQAQVDKIMEDPKLIQKLIYIQKIIAEQKEKFNLTAIPHETAPDPYKLDGSRTATLKERMVAARQIPEHVEAMRRLRVKLPAPFNISPALKSFNEAIEYAYIGANDDIRRILWRSYQKAKTLPTFRQSMSDDAWDILYYSQAVTWGSNQNRESHLRSLLKDLHDLGREGPPTHPSSLVGEKD